MSIKIQREKEKIVLNIINKVNAGESAFDSFRKYIFELIDQKKFRLIEEVFNKEWGVRLNSEQVIESVLRGAFNKIRLATPSKFQRDYAKLLTVYDIYQVGLMFYRNGTNEHIGVIKITETREENNFYDDVEFLDKTKQIKTELLVTKPNGDFLIFSEFDDEITSSENLFRNYDNAFQFMTT